MALPTYDINMKWHNQICLMGLNMNIWCILAFVVYAYVCVDDVGEIFLQYYVNIILLTLRVNMTKES